jgi:TatA/E family protein of Tat protein translocase
MGFGEIFVVLFIVLLFFGSKSIPTIARTLGKAMREVKTATGEIQREIRDTANDVTSDVQKMRELNIKRHMEEAMSDDPAPKVPSLEKPAPKVPSLDKPAPSPTVTDAKPLAEPSAKEEPPGETDASA